MVVQKGDSVRKGTEVGNERRQEREGSKKKGDRPLGSTFDISARNLIALHSPPDRVTAH
jgi:hypothetical protein